MSTAKSKDTRKRDHWSLSVPSSQIINLIQQHLTETGLKETSSALLAETNIGSRGLLSHAHTHIIKCCKQGDWGTVLEALSNITLDDGTENIHMNHATCTGRLHELDKILAQVHEMAILELADAAEMDLAFATLKICRDMLDKANANAFSKEKETDALDVNTIVSSDGVLSKSVERRLHAITALRSVRAAAAASASSNNETDTSQMLLLPQDYYGPSNVTKEKRRNLIAKHLGDIIPIIPSSRLVSLCQQAIKWQMHTGEMPMVKELWDEDEENENGIEQDGERKKRKKSKQKKRFDLVMGEVNVEIATGDILDASSTGTRSKSSSVHERIPLDPYSTIKFGKKTVVTSCTFFIDTNANQTSLITGTSDGFIEVWDEESKYTKLRMDLDYQKKEELMCHDVSEDDADAPLLSILAMKVNSDGTMLATGDSIGSINIWNIQTGQCLCHFEKVHGGAVTSLDFSRDGGRILSGSQDGTCREFGLRTKRMLKEFRGHTSFVNSCQYVVPSSKSADPGLLVVTGSADSTVRVWCGRSAEEKHALNPMSATGPSAVVSLPSTSSGGVENDGDLGRNIHTVIPLHRPAGTMVIVPRGPKAYLVTLSGLIIRTFENESVITAGNDADSTSKGPHRGDFVAATISTSNKWLYLVTDGGACLCFDVASGAVSQTITDFGLETTGGKSNIEISAIAHHPLKGILAAYSSSTSQKRGLVTIWK